MTHREEVEQQFQLLAIYRRNLAQLLLRAAQYGGPSNAPIDVMNGIHEAREQIAHVRYVLRKWNVTVPNHPDDQIPLLESSEAYQTEQQSFHIETSKPLLPDASAPFIAGPPITHPQRFFGRERELRRLFSLVKQPPLQNAAIVGVRRSGKTSLLNCLRYLPTVSIEQLRPDQHHVNRTNLQHNRWVYIDFQDPRMRERERVLRYLLLSFQLPVPNHCTLETFFDAVSYNLHQPTVVLLDEIGIALQRYPELDNSFWEALRALATNHVNGNLGFVLAAHAPPDQLAQQSDFGSPFFNIFSYTTILGPFTETEAHAFINSSSVAFAPDDIEWMIAQSQCWPMLLQIFCRERLVALEMNESADDWRHEALQQAKPFLYLRDTRI